MKILVIGMGHVGVITAYKLIQKTKKKIFVYDNSKYKFNLIKKKEKIISEKNIDYTFFYKNINFLDKENFKTKFDLIFICTSVPYNNKVKDYDFKSFFTITKKFNSKIFIFRSTVGLSFDKYKEKFKNFIYWPEFLREGFGLSDFENDDFLMYANKKRNISYLKKIFNKEINFVDLKTLILIKTISNAFRATKVAIANEIGRILKKNDVDISKFYKIFIKLRGNGDKKYLYPGDPYGGYCLPKELNYIQNIDKNLPIFSNTEKSNNLTINLLYKKIIKENWNKILFNQLSFKSDISDYRSSPFLKLAQKLHLNGRIVYSSDINKPHFFKNISKATTFDCVIMPNNFKNKLPPKIKYKFKNIVFF